MREPSDGGRMVSYNGEWSEALWARLSASMDDMYAAVVAMWHLQRVAAKKRDPISHACFADVLAPATTDGSPPPQLAERFWRAFCETVGQHMANAHRSAGFIRDALSEGYPRLAALFDGMLERLERDTDVRGVAPAVPFMPHAMHAAISDSHRTSSGFSHSEANSRQKCFGCPRRCGL